MARIIQIIILFVLVSGFTNKPKKFPEISYVTNQGQNFTNTDFIGKNTIVVLFHLGCPPAMSVLRDIQVNKLAQKNDIQIVGIVENTPQQIKDFNSSADNAWSEVRKQYNLEPVQIPLMGECSPSDERVDKDGTVIMGAQCDKVAKKIRTRYSPTLVYVNKEGNIVKVSKGYSGEEVLTDMSLFRK